MLRRVSSGWSVALRLVQPDITSASVEDLEEAQARLDFVKRNIGELIYDIRCRRGHATLRTGPQIARALRRTPGRWVSLLVRCGELTPRVIPEATATADALALSR